MGSNSHRFALATFSSSDDLRIVQAVTSDTEQFISSLNCVQCYVPNDEEGLANEEKDIDLALILNELYLQLERSGMNLNADFINGSRTDILRCILFYGRSRKVKMLYQNYKSSLILFFAKQK